MTAHPERGARFLLELEGGDDAEARYALTIFTPGAALRGRARVSAESGEVEVDVAEAPEVLVGEARALAKTLVNPRRTEGRWKRRLMRWREV
ncbi:MAG: hypothetical protein GXY23_00430 [Myxococcales bacterium]|jgi:hypothetical protein|nr:hypothetical protein [Myxococcales bacterium]